MGGRVSSRAGAARALFAFLFAGTLALLAFLAPSNGSAASSVPLPPDTNVVAPASDVAPEISVFSGKWIGVWDDTLEHVLVVEKVTPPDASAIYAYGEAPSWGITKGGFNVVKGRIEPCTLMLTLPRPATVTYRMQRDGTLDAMYEWSGGTSHATLKRAEEQTASGPSAATPNCPVMSAALRALLDARKLPSKFKGWYRFKSPVDFNEYAQTTEFEITSQDDLGDITGFFSLALPRWGTRPDALCAGADRLPMTGHYDGTKIVLSIKGSQNGPGCENYTRMFVRTVGHYFERRASDNSWYWYYDAAE